MDEMWKLVLLNQFHDIIPGSSIQRVYEEAEADFLTVLDLNPARSGPLVAMAEERIREIRYGYLR